jgi:hypothetical protein
MIETTDKPLKIWPNESGVVISHAFTLGGEHYYYVKDVFNTFAHRAMEALAVYDRWNMRCTRQYLLDWKASMKEVTTSKIDFNEFYKLLGELYERLDFALPTEEIIFEFAAVAFFDEHESPYKYDNEYGKEKITRWKALGGDAEYFFFKTPIKDLIPLPDLSADDFQTYLSAVNQMDQKQKEHLFTLISQNQQNPDSFTVQSLQKNLQST